MVVQKYEEEVDHLASKERDLLLFFVHLYLGEHLTYLFSPGRFGGKEVYDRSLGRYLSFLMIEILYKVGTPEKGSANLSFGNDRTVVAEVFPFGSSPSEFLSAQSFNRISNFCSKS